jgi:O-antigen ligase
MSHTLITPLLATSTLGHVAERIGVIAVALLAAAGVLLAGRPALARVRGAAMLAALVLTPVLLVGAIWNSPQLHPLRHHPLYGVVAVVVLVGLIAALARAVRRRPALLPVAAVAALPFRLPISSGGQTSNLLIPLYVVVAAGVLAYALPLLRRTPAPTDTAPLTDGVPSNGASASDEEPPLGVLEWALMGLVVLYAIQSSYSADFTKALENVVFFYVPFALLLVLLRRVTWTRRLVLMCFAALVALAIVFVGVGFIEYYRRELFLNPSVISSNQIESYFRVNSLFFDPNIYGRFLALVMVAVTAAVVWSGRRRDVLVGALALALLLGGMVTTFSQTSLAALLLGLAVLAALRWDARKTAAASLALVAAGAVFLAVAGGSVRFHVGSSSSANKATSGRYSLIKGGLSLFGDRPLQGYGSGSFALQYRQRHHSSSQRAASASHTIPVTVAAEQGVVGLCLYVAVLLTAFARLFGRAGLRTPVRAALAAAFAALILHTMAYAAFLEDPLTWTLLGVATAVAYADRLRARAVAPTAAERAARRARERPAPASA